MESQNVKECLKVRLNLREGGEGGEKKIGEQGKKHGECLVVPLSHTRAPSPVLSSSASSTNGSVTKPVQFAYWPTCQLRVNGQPHPALLCGH